MTTSGGRMLVLLAVAAGCQSTRAETGTVRPGGDCEGLPDWNALKSALTAARAQNNGGFNLEMWGAIVNRDGVVCAVAFTGSDRGAQWPGSRVISAQKANTANAFSLDNLSFSTAALYPLVQPGASLYGLQHSNPVDPTVAYGGEPINYGRQNDPMTGRRIGGVNVFGGGLALYSSGGKIVGGLGVSGDASCADHNIAWRTRDALGLDFLPCGASDNISYGPAAHPDCGSGVAAISAALPTTNPPGQRAGCP